MSSSCAARSRAARGVRPDGRGVRMVRDAAESRVDWITGRGPDRYLGIALLMRPRTSYRVPSELIMAKGRPHHADPAAERGRGGGGRRGRLAARALPLSRGRWVGSAAQALGRPARAWGDDIARGGSRGPRPGRPALGKAVIIGRLIPWPAPLISSRPASPRTITKFLAYERPRTALWTALLTAGPTCSRTVPQGGEVLDPCRK